MKMKTTDKRIALITGATRGLGLEAARRLAAADHLVVVTARDGAAAKALATDLQRAGHASLGLALDVNDGVSLSEVARVLEAELGRIDVLVNNAGIFLDGNWGGNTAATISYEALRNTFETNFFAQVRLTQALLPLLKRGRDPHIVNVSSIMGSLTLHANPDSGLRYVKPFAYDASKTALNAFTVHLAEALAGDGIRVNSAHPGWVRTQLGTAAAQLSVEEGVRTIVDLALSRDKAMTGKFIHNGAELPW
jgi:NAD(P)-dependent dehydrogenase (short-subunit alcohol dehydrogenase family)